MTALLLENVSFTLGTKPLVNHVGFSADPGSITVLAGPNGSGKTTLLRLAAGLLNPTAGHVFWKGVDISSQPGKTRARTASWMPAAWAQDLPFTVLDILLAAKYPERGRWADPTGTDWRDASSLVQRLEITSLDVAEFLDRDFSTLSDGEAQCVQFARVLFQDTPLLFLDEPTSALDLRHRALFETELKAVCREGKTVLMSLHDLNEAVRFGNRVVVLDRGTLAATGPTKEVLTPELIEQIWKVSGRWTAGFWDDRRTNN